MEDPAEREIKSSLIIGENGIDQRVYHHKPSAFPWFIFLIRGCFSGVPQISGLFMSDMLWLPGAYKKENTFNPIKGQLWFGDFRFSRDIDKTDSGVSFQILSEYTRNREL